MPPNVAIAEGIRLARKFATPAASLFVNAMLDQQKKKMLGQVIDKEVLDSAFNLHEQQSDHEKEAALEDKEAPSEENETT